MCLQQTHVGSAARATQSAPGQRPHFLPFFLPPLPPGLPAPAALPDPAGAPAGCLALAAGAAFFVRPGCRGTSSATLSNSTLPARAAAWPCQTSELGQPSSAVAAPPVSLTMYALGCRRARALLLHAASTNSHCVIKAILVGTPPQPGERLPELRNQAIACAPQRPYPIALHSPRVQ